jgi:hypothetical protein
MSFTHIVTFRWKSPDQASASSIADLVAGFDGVESYRCGSDIGLTPSSYDFAVVGTFSTRAAFENYRDNPDHQRIIEEMISPLLDRRTVVQLED